jgi:Leucine rich repeat
MVRRSNPFHPPEASPLDFGNDAASDVGSDIMTVSDIHTINNEQELAIMLRNQPLPPNPHMHSGVNSLYSGGADEIHTVDPNDNASIVSDLQNTVGTGGAADDIHTVQGNHVSMIAASAADRVQPLNGDILTPDVTKPLVSPNSENFWSRTRRSLGWTSAAVPLTAQRTSEDEYFDEGMPVPPPPAVIVTTNSQRTQGVTGSVDSSAYESVWKQKLCGIRADRLVVLLILVLLAAVGVIVGAVVVSQKDSSSTTSNSSSAEGDRPGDGNFITLTRTPVAIQTPVSAPVSLASSGAPVIRSVCDNNVTLVDDVKVEFPVTDDGSGVVDYRNCSWVANSPDQQDVLCQSNQIPYELCRLTCKNCNELPMGQKKPWPTDLCGGDSDMESFDAGEGLGLGNCDWLSKSPFEVTRLCQPNNDAYRLCRETCRNCGPMVNDTAAPSPAPKTEKPSDAPSAAPVKTSPPSVLRSSSFPSGVPVVAPNISTEPPVTTQPGTAEPTIPAGLEQILLTASPSSGDRLSTTGSSQARALDWLQFTMDSSLPNGVSNDRLVQLWSLATFAFSSGFDFTWLTNGGGDECVWDGVSCDSSGVVDGIALESSSLFGMIPPELALLTALSSLILSSNSLTGPIPSSFGNLQQLQDLHLDRNSLSGSIPDTVGDMTALRIWYMERNPDISGTIPSSVGQLTNLEEWVFYGTAIAGDFPQDVCSLPNLSTLELDCRKINNSCYTRCLLACGGTTGVPCNR